MSDTNNNNSNTKYVLSLDGGGVRVFYIATILTRLRDDLKIDLDKQFDLIVGSSGGGLLALYMAKCKQMGEKSDLKSIFSKKNMETFLDKSAYDDLMGLAQFEPKYSGKGKRSVLHSILGDVTLKDLSDQKCAVVTYNVCLKKPQIFSTYDANCEYYSALDIADATSAAPGYFPCVTFQQTKCKYIDGGVSANNPVLAAFTEARKLWPDSDIRILSIGSGIEPATSNSKLHEWGTLQWLNNGLLDLLLNAPNEFMNSQTRLLMHGINNKNFLFRLNGAVPKIELDDYSEENMEKLEKNGIHTVIRMRKFIKQFFDPTVEPTHNFDFNSSSLTPLY